MHYFIGIDPSINSSGVCIQKYDDNDKFISEQYYIIKPVASKITRKEKKAHETLPNFEYVFYDAEDLKAYEDNGDFREYWKSWNMINCAKKIQSIIDEFTKDAPNIISIVIEGISYGSSLRTKSIYDLAGLNYLIREKFIMSDKYIFTICPPAEIKKFITGKGNANKDIIVTMFLATHPSFNIIPKVDDISDAHYMASYAHKIYTDCIPQLLV